MIAESSVETANRFVRRTEEKFTPLCQHPELGPRRDVLATGLRASVYRSYIIYYRATETALIIVRVLHGARDAAAVFGAEHE